MEAGACSRAHTTIITNRIIYIYDFGLNLKTKLKKQQRSESVLKIISLLTLLNLNHHVIKKHLTERISQLFT